MKPYPFWTYALIVGLALITSLFVGKMRYDETGISFQRPITAVLIFIALITAFLEDKE
ncbi:hypothetical protein [Flaviaesturariibacter amylovorans]|uniref:Uncharacterized protein n=1 Tax=Flaviaesturariibacter amylovorans TaxID=1084520 RepID=A0ABP8GR36_9BACT